MADQLGLGAGGPVGLLPASAPRSANAVQPAPMPGDGRGTASGLAIGSVARG